MAAAMESSITKIDSTEFGIDANEIAAIKAQMQAAVDGGFVAGNILLVGNSKGSAFLKPPAHRVQNNPPDG